MLIWVPLDLEKEMATHSSILAWRIPGMGEPGGLPSAMILETRKIKSDTVSPSICHEVMGLDAMILVFE